MFTEKCPPLVNVDSLMVNRSCQGMLASEDSSPADSVDKKVETAIREHMQQLVLGYELAQNLVVQINLSPERFPDLGCSHLAR